MRIACSLFIISSFICLRPLTAQNIQRYPIIDKHALSTTKTFEDSLSTGQAELKALVDYLVKPATDDFEIARSLYTWLIHALAFDQKAYRDGNKRLNYNIGDILHRRKAVCFGYAQLFRQLCREAGLACEIISGYAKSNLHDTFVAERANHAWNAVQLEGQWYLLDATWASNLLHQPNDFIQQFGSNYFLTTPKLFVLEHLPSDPLWQLLPCPISAAQFQLPAERLLTLIQSLSPCMNLADSLTHFAALSPLQKQLRTAFNAYRFLPGDATAAELSATYMDYEYYLSEYADKLQVAQQYDSLRVVQVEMIRLCERAEKLEFLFDNQRENCAYTHMNYATALSDLTQHTKDADRLKLIYEEMYKHYSIAATIFHQLPLNIFSNQALESCEEYLKWLEALLQK